MRPLEWYAIVKASGFESTNRTSKLVWDFDQLHDLENVRQHFFWTQYIFEYRTVFLNPGPGPQHCTFCVCP